MSYKTTAQTDAMYLLKSPEGFIRALLRPRFRKRKYSLLDVQPMPSSFYAGDGCHVNITFEKGRVRYRCSLYNICKSMPPKSCVERKCDYVAKYENVLVRDELALDALKEEIRLMVEKTNVEHPKLKSIRYSAGNCGNKLSALTLLLIKWDVGIWFLSWIYAGFARLTSFVKKERKER